MELYTIGIIAFGVLFGSLLAYRFVSKRILAPADPFDAASSALRGRGLASFKKSWEE